MRSTSASACDGPAAASSGRPSSSAKNSDQRDDRPAPAAARIASGVACAGAPAAARRESASRSARRRGSRRSGPSADGTASARIAAPTAIVARSRSGHRLRAIPHTAWATTATATIFSPCSHGRMREIAEGGHAIAESDHRHGRGQREPEPGGERPGRPARRMPIVIPTWLLAGPAGTGTARRCRR